MTCRDTCHVSRHALTLAWAAATWHEGDVTKADAGTRLGAGDTLVPKRISDPVWCISWVQSDIYLGSNLMYRVLDPIRHTSHSSLSYSTISTHTHTHRGEGGFEWSSDVKSCFAGIHPTVLLWPRKLKLWGEYPPSYHQQIFQNLAMLSFLRRHMHKLHSDDDCIKFGLSSYCGADHPPYILGSNSTD